MSVIETPQSGGITFKNEGNKNCGMEKRFKQVPCNMPIPEIVTYEKIRVPAGHFRRVLQLAFNKYFEEELQESIRNKIKLIGEEEGADLFNKSQINCALVSPLLTLGFDFLDENSCGMRMNGQSCLGNVEVQDAKTRAYIRLIKEMDEEIGTQNNKIHQLENNVESMNREIATKDGTITTLQSEKGALERMCSENEQRLRELEEQNNQLQSEAILVASQIAEKDELIANQAAQLEAAPSQGVRVIREQGEGGEGEAKEDEDLSFIKEGLTKSDVISLLDESERLKNIRESAIEYGTQSAITYFIREFDLELSHGVEVYAVLEQEKKPSRLRIEYQMKCIFIARKAQTRIIPLNRIKCAFKEQDQFNLLKEKGHITQYQATNAMMRLILFGLGYPLVFEFKTSVMKEKCYKEINSLLDSIDVDEENITGLQVQYDIRQKNIHEILETKAEEGDREIPSDIQLLKDTPNASYDEDVKK